MRTVASLTLACVLLSTAVFAATDAMPDWQPERIEELSAADAHRLASEFDGATVEIPIREGGSQKLFKTLSLPRLRSLSPEAAAGLAEFGGNALLLDGLTELSPETAAALAAFGGKLLSLAGLTELSPEAAAALRGFCRDRLRLDGLKSLEPDVARALAPCAVRSLGLDGVTTLAPEAAGVVTTFAAREISLAGLGGQLDRAAALTSADAALFALVAARDRHPLAPSWPVRLGGIEALDTPAGVETARILAASSRGLLLPKLQRLSPEAARALAEFKGDAMELPALVEIEPAAAEALAVCPARLVMLGLRQRFGRLHALTPDDVPLVRLMSREQVGVRLEQLESLDTLEAVVTARTLAAATTLIVLPQVRRISVDAARELSAFKGEMLVLNGLTELEPDAAAALAAVQVRDLRLNGLEELSAESAGCLARCGIPGMTDLHLDGVTALAPEAAEQLAGFSGNQLFLNGLTALSPEAAKSLARAQCRVLCGFPPQGFDRFDAIGVDQARVLTLAVRNLRVAFVLKNVTTIDSVEAASMLAALPVRLTLPGLRRVAPQTFAALVAKKDVLVPRLEAIEFITDQAGGAADDFELPDGFDAQQETLWGAGRRPPLP